MWNSTAGFMDGGNAGAGFMNSPSQFASPAQGKKERRSQNIIPVTVKMILNSPGDSLIVAGSEANIIVLVGIIISVDISSTKITYSLDDSTGVIELVQWLESEGDAEAQGSSTLMEMTYCKVYGTMRTQQGKKHIMVFNIVPLTDMNRLTTHILEVIQTPLKLQQIQNQRMNGATTSAQGMTQAGLPTMENGGQHSAGDGGNMQGLTGPSKIVYQIIKMCNDEVGIERSQIYDTLKGKVNSPTIDKLLEDLSNEGLIFCSIDDDHFKSADS